MVELNQNGAIPWKLPLGRHQHDGHSGEPHREGADGAGHHPGGPSEKDHEQRAKHPSSNPGQRSGRVLSVNYILIDKERQWIHNQRNYNYWVISEWLIYEFGEQFKWNVI